MVLLGVTVELPDCLCQRPTVLDKKLRNGHSKPCGGRGESMTRRVLGSVSRAVDHAST